MVGLVYVNVSKTKLCLVLDICNIECLVYCLALMVGLVCVTLTAWAFQLGHVQVQVKKKKKSS